MCQQFSLFSQIILVGVFILQSSLIIVELFLLLRFNKLRVLEDYLVPTDVQTQNFICFNTNNIKNGTTRYYDPFLPTLRTAVIQNDENEVLKVFKQFEIRDKYFVH
ncbi:Hypothetical_protein [Hexamita inflata]|uniref:Hypothetical_protein n=1 Tax=Hexamita inflata TaxID=28002 RepID=A0AA86NQ33_9EUKA|nr:Hypothetical protein HINF_LOCUS10866 [Hexamita inflata]